jgi:hypothetical protein
MTLRESCIRRQQTLDLVCRRNVDRMVLCITQTLEASIEPERIPERYKLMKRRVHTRETIQQILCDERKRIALRSCLTGTRRELFHFQDLALDVLLGLKDHLKVACDIGHHLFGSSLGLIADFLFSTGNEPRQQADSRVIAL